LPVVEHCTYIDTHVHLEYILEKVSRKGGKQQESQVGAFEATPMEKILKSFPSHANFEGCIAVFCDATALSPSLAIWPEFLLDDRIWAAFGLHPHTSQYYTDSLEERIKDALKHEKAVAWGECGLDFAKMHSPKETQMNVFKRQILAAVSIGKPIMVHSRKAAIETFDLLAENAPENYPIHIHCFGDSVADAERYLKHFSRLYIGFTGMITWDKSDDLREVVKSVPLDRILLETDAPYHFPGNNPKATNHSGTIPAIAAEIAKLKDVPLEVVYFQIRQNTTDIYGI
jgi:TatD DNase family protein